MMLRRLRKKITTVVSNKEKELTFQQHVHELAMRCLAILGVWLLVFGCCYLKINELLNRLLLIGEEQGYKFVYLSPQEVILQQLKFSGIMAFAIVVPFSMIMLIGFVFPGFSWKKVLGTALTVGSSCGCFVAGVYLSYKWLLPFMLSFLRSVNQFVAAEGTLDIAKYLGFVFGIVVAIGFVSEIPVVVVGLSAIGILDYNQLKKTQGLAVVVVFVVAAVITPPDVVSQIAVGLPMLLLYECSVGISWVLTRKRTGGS